MAVVSLDLYNETLMRWNRVERTVLQRSEPLFRNRVAPPRVARLQRCRPFLEDRVNGALVKAPPAWLATLGARWCNV